MEEVLLKARSRDGGPAFLEDYRAAGGYRALGAALRERSPADLIETVKQSGLRGRGGAGFPSGMKWSFMAAPEGQGAPSEASGSGARYLVCNADEMEPGTFKDRVLMERNPHLLIEGMAIAGYAMAMTEAYLFIRREYFAQARILERALGEARSAGLLGTRIGGSGFSFDIHLHASGGRYICGEETALLNALEGRRPIPRAKPPFPAAHGLWTRPTTVHNVETLCCVPGIAERGAAWFKGLARNPEGAGNKIFGGSGAIARPMALERPIGTPLAELIDEMGGVRGGRKVLAVLPGGASTPFVTAEHLDTPMDFDPLVKVGSRLGTGTFIVLSEDDCPLDALLNLQRFFARESCGWCTPCRDGLPYGVRLLRRLEDGEGSLEEIDRLENLYRNIGPNSFCALAAGAAEPLLSLLRHFRDLLEEHVRARGCPFAARREAVHA